MVMPTDKESQDEKRLKEGGLFLIAAAMALDGITLALWSFAGIVFIVFMIFVILAKNSHQ
jgi:hypothetical protein